MAIFTRFFALVSLVFLSANGFAVQLEKLYNASVTVASQDASDRKLGFNLALDQVLIRLTGNESLVMDTQLRRQLGSAENFVLSFGFRENPEYTEYLRQLSLQDSDQLEVKGGVSYDNEQEDSSELTQPITTDLEVVDLMIEEESVEEPLIAPDQFLLDVVFAESALRGRLQSLSLPIWGKARPSILVWVVLSGQEGDRTVIGASEIDQYIPELGDESALRGVPLYIPVADLTDLSLLDVDGLWGLFSDSHHEASQRYDADAVAILRLHAQIPDQSDAITPQVNESDMADENLEAPMRVWASDWQLFLGEQTFFGETGAVAEDQLASWFVSSLAQVISSQYAVTGTIESDVFSIEVLGVEEFSDYVRVQRYLEELAPVSSVEMVGALSNALTFNLSLRDTRDMFFQHLSLGRKLIKLEDSLPVFTDEDILAAPVQKFLWQSGN